MEKTHRKRPGRDRAHLTEGPVAKMLVGMTLPMTVGIFSLVLFNLVDMFFVGRLGTRELAALSFTFPVVTIIGSFVLGIGTGASAVISKAIGEGDLHKVRALTTDSIMLSIVLGILFMIIGSVTVGPVFRVLGVPRDILPIVRQYMNIWYSGLIFLVIPMIGNNAIRATGDMKSPAIIMVFAVFLNIALDPLFIFGLGPFPAFGVAGAAMATVISRSVTLILSLYILHFKKKMLTFRKRTLNEKLGSWKDILRLGIPTAGTRLIFPVATAVIVRLVSVYGPEAVAGFGVGSRIEFFALTVVLSLATVLGPFVGQNWGAGENGRVVSGIGISKFFAMVWGMFIFVLVFFTAEPLSRLFNDNIDVIRVSSMYLRTVSPSYGFFGVLIISAITITVLHKPLHAAGLMVFSMLVLCLPLAVIMSRFLGISGIFAAITFSYIAGGGISNITLARVVKNLKLHT